MFQYLKVTASLHTDITVLQCHAVLKMLYMLFCYVRCCTDAVDDMKWEIALCTYTIPQSMYGAVDSDDDDDNDPAISPIQWVTKLGNSRVASLILKCLAVAWNTTGDTGHSLADSIYMPDLLELLKAFPTLAVPFLAEQITLMQAGEPTLLHLAATSFRTSGIHPTASFNANRAYSDFYGLSKTSSCLECLPRFFIHIVKGLSFVSFELQVHQQVVPVPHCNTVQLLEAAIGIAEDQQSAYHLQI
jgi:hypothetical protein